ncbi:MAG: primosomal protein N' [Fimbriimonadaceae bacterium]|nr:primosomal protein N' [Fimbriimonadaceae bacterium]
MPERILVADVGMESRAAGADAVYTYAARPGLRVGDAHLVPLGPRVAVGYVLAVREVEPEGLGFDPAMLKPVGPQVRGMELPPPTLDLVHEVARQTLSSLSTALGPAVPPGTRDRLVTTWEWTGRQGGGDLSPALQECLRVLQEKAVVDTKAKPLPGGTKRHLLDLEGLGLARQVFALAPAVARRGAVGPLRLTPDNERVEKFLAGPGRRKPAQSVTLMRLQGSEGASFSAQEIKSLGGVTDQTVKALVDAGLLVPSTDETVAARPPKPNLEQQAAIDAVSAAVRAGRPERFLLFGVTGSGKTEVYLRCAEEALKRGRQVLYLVPEIALTAQVIAQLRARFGPRVAVLHSNMTPAERLESWLRVRGGEAPVVLGARSALFAPLHDIGLIVMDEEHEASYKQESAPRYHSRRVAVWMAGRHGCPLVTGSATPSVESFYEAETGQATLLRMDKRAASARLPDVHLVDLTEMFREHRASVFAPPLHEALGETLAAGEQAILFLNRRAYAPFVVCRDCGHRFTCPRCAVTLSFHRREHRLRCHHCDHDVPAPDQCPACCGDKVNAFGVGAEKVEEAVTVHFPTARVARLDRDVVRRKGALEETLAKFRGGELDVLVGTQMVAKGLDFPNVTLVGVIAADISLNIPDFRASERTFQLLSQVAGRAGRGQKPGRVFIQTLSHEHPSVVAAQSHDYESLYRALKEERQAVDYPPFRLLVNVVFSGPVRQAVVEHAAAAGQRLRTALPDAEVLGPVDCSLERLNEQWRKHVLLKLDPGADLSPVLAAVRGIESSDVRTVIDVDPYNMM